MDPRQGHVDCIERLSAVICQSLTRQVLSVPKFHELSSLGGKPFETGAEGLDPGGRLFRVARAPLRIEEIEEGLIEGLRMAMVPPERRERLESGDLPNPRWKVRGSAEGGTFSEDHEGDFLKDVLRQVRVVNDGSHIAQDGGAVREEKADQGVGMLEADSLGGHRRSRDVEQVFHLFFSGDLGPRIVSKEGWLNP